MNIPDKAVEAALRVAIFEDCGDMSVLAEMAPEERAVWEENIRAELEAAAPFIAAQALRDYADVVSDGRVSFRDSEARGLRDRAKWLEAGA